MDAQLGLSVRMYCRDAQLGCFVGMPFACCVMPFGVRPVVDHGNSIKTR